MFPYDADHHAGDEIVDISGVPGTAYLRDMYCLHAFLEAPCGNLYRPGRGSGPIYLVVWNNHSYVMISGAAHTTITFCLPDVVQRMYQRTDTWLRLSWLE